METSNYSVYDSSVTGGAIVKSWAPEVEEGALKQAFNVAQLPFVIGHVALMPDTHQGYGMPVGGAFMADKAIVPYAIGVDIGCGVVLMETDMEVGHLRSNDTLERTLHAVSRGVPVGVGPRGRHHDRPSPSTPLADELVQKVTSRTRTILVEARSQVGTLGSGNHFLEFQADEEDKVWVMIHSGSRSLGKRICDYYHKEALRLNRLWKSDLPHDEVAYLPWDTQEAKDYWTDMNAALEWAEINRAAMAAQVAMAVEHELNGAHKAWLSFDCHHNYAAWESHLGKNGIVHRKGAVRARVDDAVLIPGSMTTGSFVGQGLGNPDSLQTCQHGAGRTRSRAATRKLVSLEDMEAQLEAANVILSTPDRKGVTDESAPAYKDIETVMALSSDLVAPTKRLRPLAVLKG